MAVVALLLAACGNDAETGEGGGGSEACDVFTAAEIATVAGVASATADQYSDTRCEYVAGSATIDVAFFREVQRTLEEERVYAAGFPSWELVDYPDIGDVALAEYQPAVNAAGSIEGQRLLHLYVWIGDRQVDVTPLAGTNWAPDSPEVIALLEVMATAADRL